jgi:single-stranded-DNA-specific exonuclease
LEIDAEAPLAQLTVNTLAEIERLAPFGQDNPRPVLCATGVSLASEPKTMGSDGRHLALQLEQHNVRLRAVAFGKSDWLPTLSTGGATFDFAFKPVINQFNGRRKVELQLIDFRPSAPAS